MRTVCVALLLAVLAMNVCGLASADAVTLTSARLDQGSLSLMRLIRTPKLALDQSVTVACQALVSVNGRIAQVQCGADGAKENRYARAIRSAAKRAKVQSAMVNEKPITVWVPFQVRFSRDSSAKREATYYPNHATEPNLTTVDPQRVFDNDDADCKGIEHSRVRVSVDQVGRPTLISVIDSIEDERCKTALASRIERASFIPAHQQGVAVAAEIDTRFLRFDTDTSGPFSKGDGFLYPSETGFN